MEESLRYFKEQFQLADVDVRTYSPLALAYIGDSIYDLLVRTMIMSEGNMPVQQLHRFLNPQLLLRRKCFKLIDHVFFLSVFFSKVRRG